MSIRPKVSRPAAGLLPRFALLTAVVLGAGVAPRHALADEATETAIETAVAATSGAPATPGAPNGARPAKECKPDIGCVTNLPLPRYVSLKGDQGNARRGLTPAQNFMYEIWTGIALVPATPFALSEALPPQAWKALDILLRMKR